MQQFGVAGELINGGRGSRSSATVFSATFSSSVLISSCFVVKEAKVLKAKVVAKVVLSTKDRVTVAPLGQASGCTTSGY